jgi:hypothetical protein
MRKTEETEMTDNQAIKVAKQEKKVEILFQSNQFKTEECILFLNQYSRFGSEGESLEEFLNNHERFIPVKITNSNKFTVINLSNVIYIMEAERARFFAKKKIILFLDTDVRIEVGHSKDLPDHHSRILDYLNQREQFVMFLLNGKRIYINKDKIIKSIDYD